MCVKCGHELPGKGQFCPFCGEKVKLSAASNEKGTPRLWPVAVIPCFFMILLLLGILAYYQGRPSEWDSGTLPNLPTSETKE